MIKLRRQGGGASSSSAAQAPVSLSYGEPAVSSDGTLYVGDGSGGVVSKVKNAESSAMADDVDPDKYYNKEQVDQNIETANTELTSKINAIAAKYTGKFTLDGWVASTSEEQAAGYTLAQEVMLTAVTSGAPTVMAASEFLTGCGYDPTGVAATDEILDEVLAIINAGVTRSLDGGKIRTIVKEKPAADIVLHWVIRTEVS